MHQQRTGLLAVKHRIFFKDIYIYLKKTTQNFLSTIMRTNNLDGTFLKQDTKMHSKTVTRFSDGA